MYIHKIGLVMIEVTNKKMKLNQLFEQKILSNKQLKYVALLQDSSYLML